MAIFRRSGLSAAYVRTRVSYDPETGILRWLPIQIRPARARTDKAWNGNFAGKEISHINDKGYVLCRLDGILYYAHRIIWLIMTGEWPPDDIDHIDCIRSNNVWANLRQATRSQNRQNTALELRNSTGYKGITRLPSGNYCAKIKKNGTHIYLGTFPDPMTAHLAYKCAAERLFGPYARMS